MESKLSMVEKNAFLKLTNPDYPGHQVVLEHQHRFTSAPKSFAQAAEVLTPEHLERHSN